MMLWCLVSTAGFSRKPVSETVRIRIAPSQDDGDAVFRGSEVVWVQLGVSELSHAVYSESWFLIFRCLGQ